MTAHDDYLDPDRYLQQEEPEYYENAWNVINTFFCVNKDNRDEKLIKRMIYKGTDCGAWIDFDENGIKLGSIVEGTDFSCQSYFLSWRNISEESISERIHAIETEADALWMWANAERDDGRTDAEAGLDFPDVCFDYSHLL